MWQVYAVLSAVFASLTALFSKMGVRGIDSNLATAVRVSFILILVWGIVIFTGKVGEVRSIQPRTMLFLFLSAIATGGFSTSRPCSSATCAALPPLTS